MEHPLTRDLFDGILPDPGTRHLFSMWVVVGCDLKEYVVEYIRVAGQDSFVRLIAAPGTSQQYAYSINLAITVGENEKSV